MLFGQLKKGTPGFQVRLHPLHHPQKDIGVKVQGKKDLRDERSPSASDVLRRGRLLEELLDDQLSITMGNLGITITVSQTNRGNLTPGRNKGEKGKGRNR